MEDNKMRELNLDEMDKVIGGGDPWTHENDKFYWEAERCACGGRFILISTEKGDLRLKCESCGNLNY